MVAAVYKARFLQFNRQILEKVYCQDNIENLKTHTKNKSPYAVHETVIFHCDIPRNSTSVEQHAEYKDPHEDVSLRKLFFVLDSGYAARSMHTILTPVPNTTRLTDTRKEPKKSLSPGSSDMTGD